MEANNTEKNSNVRHSPWLILALIQPNTDTDDGDENQEEIHPQEKRPNAAQPESRMQAAIDAKQPA